MSKDSEFKIKTIMLATDFSPASYGAWSYAGELARVFSAKILLTHVIDPTLLTKAERSNLCDMIDSAEKELQGRVEQFAEDFIESRVIVRQGDIRETILSLIAERNVDLLVLGTKGKTTRQGEELGSVAERLLRAMPCPVLTVCMNARTGALDGTRQQRVLVPIDFSPASGVALEYAECLTRSFGGRLYLLHVEESASPSRLVMKSGEPTGEFKGFGQRMKDPSLVAGYITCTGSPAERIVAVAAEKDLNLIVMRAHEGGRLQGVVYDVIRSAKCPVFTLFVPSEKEIVRKEEVP